MNAYKMQVEEIARVAHEINRAFCESNGDYSQPLWQDASEWQKSSAYAVVQFHLSNPDASASATHDEWMRHKIEMGWKYGVSKNPETKEHPCIVPYEQLPETEKTKDHLFRQTVHSLRPYFKENNSRQA